MIGCPLVRRVLYHPLVNMKDWQKYFQFIYHYHGHPGSFTGPERLYKVVLAEANLKSADIVNVNGYRTRSRIP